MTSDTLFSPNYNKVYVTLMDHAKEMASDLFNGQTTHALQPTFDTHFMVNRGNIITLQRILGHSTVQQIKTYAYFCTGLLQKKP
jgi:integrase